VALDPTPNGGTGQTDYPNGGDIGMVAGRIGGTGPGPTGGTWSPGPTGGVGGGVRGGTGPGPTGGTWSPGPTGGTSPGLMGGAPGGSITVQPVFLEFGQVPLGSQVLRTFTIRNTGSVPVYQLNLLFGVGGTQFKMTSDCIFPLAPFAGCTVSVWFGPSVPGPVNTTLTVSSSPTASVVVQLSGTGTRGLVASMIGYWKFDDATGPFVIDSSGQSNHGTVRQGSNSSAPLHPAPVWERGRKGGALRIDGLDDWVNVPDSDSIESTGIKNNVSISAWIKLDKYNSLRPFNVVAQRHMLGTRLEQFFMGLNSGAPAVGINFFYGIGVTNVPLNEWVHMAMSYDGITQCGYINGVMSTCQDVGWPVATDETPFTMGAGIAEDDVVEHIVGLIDEVRFYDVALTSGDIAVLHATP
jgi:Concanavalin A-like lectin/glucanases superfamily/Abnormal spindle-like microcephaly-assoc'd, ASPM-SPD-2-Hydin